MFIKTPTQKLSDWSHMKKHEAKFVMEKNHNLKFCLEAEISQKCV